VMYDTFNFLTQHLRTAAKVNIADIPGSFKTTIRVPGKKFFFLIFFLCICLFFFLFFSRGFFCGYLFSDDDM
jgi:hypothetical protein